MYEVKLTTFEGPLDLLLHLIKQNEVDIYDIPIAEITEQYLEYLDLMKQLDLDVASAFLVMAATLIQIKSQSILPTPEEPEEDIVSEDAREELIRQLLEYKQFKESAEALEDKAEQQTEIFGRPNGLPREIGDSKEIFIEATLFDLLSVFKSTLDEFPDEPFMEDVEPFMEEEIQAETITVEEKMDEILNIFQEQDNIGFDELFPIFNTKLEVIVTFLAILELVRLKQIILLQTGLFGDIHVANPTPEI